MFTDYFGLTQNPFDLASDTPFLSYDAATKDICERMLQDLLDGFSPIILTGEPGSGKTQLLRRLSVLLPPDMLNVTPFNSRLNYAERVQMAIASYDKGFLATIKLLLVVDNAQEIPDADLKTLLALPQQNQDTGESFQMIWCGTNALNAKLNNINPTKFNDLYPNHYHLAGLNAAQVKCYIDDCLKRAGYSVEVQGELFSPAAINEIVKQSRGLPRLINQLCSTSLMLASLDQQFQVDRQLIQEVSTFYVISPQMAGGGAAQRVAKRSEDILRIIPEKLTLKGLRKNITRLLRYHWRKNAWRKAKPAAKTSTTFFSRRDAKFFAGGMLVSGLCLILLLNFLNPHKETMPAVDTSNAGTWIENLPATSAGNPITTAPVEAKTETHAATEPQTSNNEDEQKSEASTPIPTATSDMATLQATPLQNTNSATSTTTAVKSSRLPVAKLLRNHNGLRDNNLREKQAKPIQHKYRPKPTPKFVLKPLDAPGDWDEIVIVDDPKAPKEIKPMITKDASETPENDAKKGK
jgi:general secretion pathway protein A